MRQEEEFRMSFNIAIDGPAGAGKSTIAKLSARELSFVYVDTGAMYRAIALFLLRNHVDCGDLEQLKEALSNIHIDLSYEDGPVHLFLNGENVTDQIRTEAVSKMASVSSAIAMVRDKLTDLQRNIAAKENVIMDGRDIGTVILPGAQLKIFLTASIEVRAKRRYDEMRSKGISCNLSDIEENVRLRDERDSSREVAPLKAAEDAVVIDSSELSIEEVVDWICQLAKERGAVSDTAQKKNRMTQM